METYDLQQKVAEHDLIIREQGKRIDELTQNITDLRELITKIDKLVVRFDVTIKMMEKILWGGLGAVLLFVLNELLNIL